MNDTQPPLPPTAPPPAWTPANLAAPHAATDKRARVQRMFSAIAPKYDLNNRLHSFWRDQAWRRAAVKMAEVKPNDTVIDIACGTGDLTLAFANALADTKRKTPLSLREGEGGGVRASNDNKTHSDPLLANQNNLAADRLHLTSPGYRGGTINAAAVIGIDFTFGMLPIANRKSKIENRKSLFAAGDAQQLPLPDACCDVVSIAFGIRNVQDVPAAMAEFFRVLRPGGRLIVLEFSEPTNPMIRALNRFYCGHVMPITATLVSGDKSGAYKYLPKSVETFMTRRQMSEAMTAAGFTRVFQKPLTFGVCVCYRGVKI